MTDYPKNMTTREGIITNMCYTWDHSWGAPFQPWTEAFGCTPDQLPEGTDPDSGLGYSPKQKKALWDQMAQIFDNDIAPAMKFK